VAVGPSARVGEGRRVEVGVETGNCLRERWVDDLLLRLGNGIVRCHVSEAELLRFVGFFLNDAPVQRPWSECVC